MKKSLIIILCFASMGFMCFAYGTKVKMCKYANCGVTNWHPYCEWVYKPCPPPPPSSGGPDAML